MKNKSIFLAGMAMLALGSCKPHLDTADISAGSLDLSRYVAVGNSLTAGYSDGSLYRSGQEHSYPVMLAGQFRMLGGGDFKVPYLPGENGWPVALPTYTPKRILGMVTDCKGVTSLSPVLAGIDTAGSAVSIGAAGPYNNTGIPGIRAIDYNVPGYATLNPYAGRFFSNIFAAPVAEINRANATFFTAWIGNNDVLAYATSGGAGKSSGGTPFDLESISSVALFSIGVDSVLNRMTAGGAKGAVINIPDVTGIPYFTTVPINGLTLDATQAAGLNAAFGAAGMSFAAGNNNWVIEDTTVPGYKRRQIRTGEYVLLTIPQDSLKCAGWGSTTPIPRRYILDAGEVASIKMATLTFNQILKDGADKRGLAYVDMNTYFNTLSAGILFNGVSLTTTFVSGGLFSLDGVHLTPKGYAFVANEIIRNINNYYKANIPGVDANKYSGVKFP